MNQITRRKLFTSGLAAVAASTIPLSEAQNTPATAAGPFTVSAGEGRPRGLWLVHGEKAFSTKVSGTDVGRTYVAIEVHTPPGLGPELHVHPGQNEMFFMLRGSIGLLCGSDRTILRTGDTFMAPANVPHAYVTLGSEPAHILNVYNPAGDMEGFFAEYAPLVSVNGVPDKTKLADCYARHGMRVVGAPLKAASFTS